MNDIKVKKLIKTKKRLVNNIKFPIKAIKGEEEGGCGVVGFCCSEPVCGRHIYEPSRLMHNRGNGKGGGIAAVGFVPEQLGVSREVLNDYYMIHIAFLDPEIRIDLEKEYIYSFFDVKKSMELDTVDDWKTVPGLEVKPPDVWRYFVRVKKDVLASFKDENELNDFNTREIEDEFINQNSFNLNKKYYSSLGDQKAFVLSHGRNIMILKVVGYAEAITEYYKINDLCAHTWIAHQRFPTKGRVWHPGGAHPFAGINMALVHNGDFANYHSVSEYLLQRFIYPQFLTDTEVSALMFDLLSRTYHYPLEYIIEALAPTTELDFDRLPDDKKEIYHDIQASHIHGSPDGPWFFIITRNIPEKNKFQLLGITDTSMLRPQVFAFSEGEVQVGLIASEKQAIDATLLSLANEDKRICPVADRYWNARGGSHTDGGAFIFDLNSDKNGKIQINCIDKFGRKVPMPHQTEFFDLTVENQKIKKLSSDIEHNLKEAFEKDSVFEYISSKMDKWTFDDFIASCHMITEFSKNHQYTAKSIAVLTDLNNLQYSTGTKKRSYILNIIRNELDRLFSGFPYLDLENDNKIKYRLIDFDKKDSLRPPIGNETTLVINADRFPPEGDECDAALLVKAFNKGWRNFICFKCIGQRYVGCGLGPDTKDVTINVYGSSGDYLGSGIDGLTINVHNNAQDQLGQIIKSGKLVVYGDVGQTFMYGAKGGAVYVMGNAAGRPLINSVGKPRVVINGTCLDFLAESFMAGDPHNEGGFVILNAVAFDSDGSLIHLKEPYPGSNLFSLASGGAIFIRDPHNYVVKQQLNGGQFLPFNENDWELILPYLQENERLFKIKIDDLLTIDGKIHEPESVYRKVVPNSVAKAFYDEANVLKNKASIDI